MAAAFYFWGMVVGVIIGLEYYKYQITKKRNPKVIEKVKKWLEEAGK